MLRMVPLPRFAGEDEFNRSRRTTLRPSYATALPEIVTTGHNRSQNGVLWTPMPVVHADVTPTRAGGKHCASEASAWIAGTFLEDGASRLLPGHDERGRTEERPKEKDSEAKRRQTQLVSCRAFGHGRAWIARRPSIGVPPRLWLRRPNATTQLQFRAS
jgi:hypothetical protein